MKYNKQINRIVNYIKSGEKKKDDFTVGTEFENFIIDKDTLKTASYYGENGVGETLAELSEILNAKPFFDREYVLGFEKNDWTVSTEPGAQFELSIKSKKNIADLVNSYEDFIRIVEPVLAKKNQVLISLGYHPKTTIDEIKILPKERYSHMFNYFKNRGTMAHNMMKGTASVQVAIDFYNEDDFKKKYFLGSALSPILYTMFDNSFIFESKPYDSNNLRQKIWENTDSDRSGVLPIAFDKDLSYEKYAEFILNSPPIFMGKNGEIVSTGNTAFKDLFDPDIDSDEDIFHAMSIVFPDIRLKKYLEFRMMDGLKYPLNFSVVALIKALFYSEDNLNILYEKFKDATYKDVIDAKNSTQQLGLAGEYLGEKIYELEAFILNLAVKGLTSDEVKYLDPIVKLSNNRQRPRDIFENSYKKYGLNKAVLENKIEVPNVQ